MSEHSLISINTGLESILNVKGVNSIVNNINITQENEQSIYALLIGKGFRFGSFTKSNEILSFSSYFNEDYIGGFNIQEYPACCGKAIFNSFRVRSGIYQNSTSFLAFNQEQINKIFEFFLDYAKKILDHMGYSSFSFIVSKVEQPNLFVAVEALGFVPISIFTNRRYKDIVHVCNEYSMSI